MHCTGIIIIIFTCDIQPRPHLRSKIVSHIDVLNIRSSRFVQVIVKIVTPCFIFIAFFAQVSIVHARKVYWKHDSDEQSSGYTSTCETTFGRGCETIFGSGCGRGYVSHDSYSCLPVQLGVTFSYFSYEFDYLQRRQLASYISASPASIYSQLAMDIRTFTFISAVFLAIGSKEGLCHRCIHDRIAVSYSYSYFLYQLHGQL